AGATIASFLAWGFERGIASAKDKLKFGKGSIKGLAAPETANNAACTGSFVPLLTLGIPGSGTTAVMLGALLSFGVQPGPRLYIEQPELFWAVIVSMYIGNVVLLVLNLPLIPYIARILAIPKNILVPLVLFFSVTGVYLISFNAFDIYFMAIVALISLVLRILNFPMPPLILGFILGGMLEKNLRRALLINDGSFSFIWDRPISLSLFVIMIMIVSLQIYQGVKKRKLSPNM
ncbi:MAG: tripartite tricarboxylate transporter permease, partial [Candidatus Thioglobus sp.]